MTARERTLAFITAGILLVLVGSILSKTFLRNQRMLSTQLKEKTASLAEMKTLITEREKWEQREAWLQQYQPRLENPDKALPDLENQIKNIAQGHQLTPTDIQFQELAKGAKTSYQAVGIKFNLKGKREDLVDFLYDVQTPTSFLVFEKATMQIDKEDKTLISGTFHVSKWFAGQ